MTPPGARLQAYAAAARRGTRDAAVRFAASARLAAGAPRRRAGAAPSRGASAVEIATLAICAILACVLFLDAPSVRWARSLHPDVAGLFRVVTDAGKSDWILIPVALALLWLATRSLEGLGVRARAGIEAWSGVLAYAFVVVAGSGLVVTLAKRIIGRARPKHFDIAGPLEFQPFALDAGFASFPSGHAATVFACAAVVAVLAPRLRWPAFAIAAWLALSRVAVGAHYPSDALAGALFAVWFALKARAMFAERGHVFARDAAGHYVLKGRRLLSRARPKAPRGQGNPMTAAAEPAE